MIASTQVAHDPKLFRDDPVKGVDDAAAPDCHTVGALRAGPSGPAVFDGTVERIRPRDRPDRRVTPRWPYS
ncbi:hypothetical protein GCM10018777_06430 [Streptomyces albogriseolus]|nr:hypothetical protein GCM10018777_06430 [Streptomyces viridodiastaticus]